MSVDSHRADRDVRDFVAHQLALEIDAGRSVAVAADKIRGALATEFHWAVDEAARVLAGEPPPRAWPQLGELLATARAHGISAERTFAAFERSLRQQRAAHLGALDGARSLGLYLAALSALLILVVGLYAWWVLPSFQSMFELMGAPLPEFTASVVGNRWVLVPLLAVLVIVMALYLLGLARVRTRLENMRPVLPLLRWVPNFRAWAHAHDTSLWMRYYALFLDAGAQANVAETAAAQLAGEPRGDHRPRLLESAAKLGRLREELARLLEADVHDANERFESARNTVVLMLRLYIYILLSGYLIAMYLPIFKLGAVV